MNPSNMNQPVTPDTQPAAPPQVAPPQAPTQNPAGTASAAISGQPQATPAAPTQPQFSAADVVPNGQQTRQEHQAGVFSKILTALTPQRPDVVDAQGNIVPQTGGLGRSIVASVLAGMFQPTHYAEGMGGAQRVDPSATAAGAFQATQAKQKEMTADQQKLYDDSYARKTAIAKQNVDELHTYAAMMVEGHKDIQEQTKANQSFFDSMDEQDARQTDPSQKVRLYSGLTQDEIMARMNGKWLSQNMVVDGFRDEQDAQGHTIVKPTFSVINPSLKMPVDEKTVARLSEVNPNWKLAYDANGGSIRANAGHLLSDLQAARSLDGVESFATGNKELLALGSDKTVNLQSAFQKNPQQMRKAVNAAENIVASHGSTLDVMKGLLGDPMKPDQPGAAGGRALVQAMGVDPDKAADWVRTQTNTQIAENKVAQEGVSDKSIAPPQMVAEVTAVAKKLPKDQSDAIMAGVNPNGMTVGEVEKLKDKVLTSIQQNRTDAANNPKLGTAAPPATFVSNPNASTMDSVDLQKDLATKGVKLPTQFESLYTVAHNAAGLKDVFPTSPRKGTNGLSAQQALAFIHQYINPTYQEGDYPAAAGLSKELASTRTGTGGGSLLSAGVASNHLDLLSQAADALKNNDTQAINRLANSFGVQVGKSPAVTFNAIADQVNAEVGKVVAGGTPHEAELANLRKNLNTDQSPEQTKNVIKSYVNLMSGRINEINERSQQYFQRDVKGISPETARVFAKYGVEVPGYATVTVNGQSGAIPKSQLKAFQAKYPNATVGGQ